MKRREFIGFAGIAAASWPYRDGARRTASVVTGRTFLAVSFSVAFLALMLDTKISLRDGLAEIGGDQHHDQ